MEYFFGASAGAAEQKSDADISADGAAALAKCLDDAMDQVKYQGILENITSLHRLTPPFYPTRTCRTLSRRPLCAPYWSTSLALLQISLLTIGEPSNRGQVKQGERREARCVPCISLSDVANNTTSETAML